MPLNSTVPASLPGSYLIAAEPTSPPSTGSQTVRSTAITPSRTGLDSVAIHRCAVAISTLTSPIHRPQPTDSDPLMSSIPGYLPHLHHPALGSIHHLPPPCLLPQIDCVVGLSMCMCLCQASVFCALLCAVCGDGAFAGEPVACGMPCGHVPNLYLTSHPTPGLADSVHGMSVRSRVMFSRASHTYVLCRAVVCRVSTNGVSFSSCWCCLGCRVGTYHLPWYSYVVELSSTLFAPSTGILHGAHGA